MVTHTLAAAGAAITIALATSASASVLTFGPGGTTYNEDGQIPYTVRIDDNTAGKFTVQVSTNAGSGDDTGDILGFGFDTSLTGLSSFDLLSSSTGEGITGLYADASSCGSGCNFNGTSVVADPFDYILRIGDQGSSNGLLTDFAFTIATDQALTATSFTRVGFRTQSVGLFPDGGNGSAKDVNGNPVFTPGTPGGEEPGASPVPLPAAAWMLLAGIGGLFGMARRRAA